MTKHKKKIMLALAIVLVLTMGALFSSAVWDESSAVHIDPNAIENSTLIVGTHLIHISALTNTIYNTAQASANESGQGNTYYKSELAGGVWFDITSASTLADITTGGVPVTNDVIAALFLTHHTKSDGVTYDLRTNRPVSIFDLYSPYDLEAMEELFPLKMQYDTARELQGESETGKKYIEMVAAFFRTNVRTGATNDADVALGALQAYHDVLAANDGGAAEMEAVLGVMEAVDATRRVEVFTIVGAALETLSADLQRVVDTPADEEDEEDEGEQGSSSDANLQGGVGDSLTNVTDAMNAYSAKMLDKGVTVLSEARYNACEKLIADAKANNHAACDGDVANIIGFDNIRDGKVANRDGELALLDAPLLPAATQKYTGGLSAGDSAEYKAAEAQNAAAALKNGIVKKARNQLTIYRSELEVFIEAEVLRLGGDESLAFLDGRLASAQSYSMGVPRDDFAAAADESIEAHIDFLTRLRRSVELGMGGNATDELLARKGELQTELLSALDNNDLASAKAIQGDIAALDELLTDMPGGSGTAAAEAAENLASDLTRGMESGDGADDAAANVGALGGLLPSNYAAIFPILEDLRAGMLQKRDVDGDSSYDDAIGAIEALLLENRDAYNRATAAGLSSDEALAIAGAYFDGNETGTRLFDDGLLGGAAGAGAAGAGGVSATTGGALTPGGDLPGAGASGDGGAGTGAGTGTGAGASGAAGSTGDGVKLAGNVTSDAGLGGDAGIGAGEGDPAGLSDGEKDVALILALSQYASELGDESLNGLMRARANGLLGAEGALVFGTLRDSASQYMPARVVAEYLKLRYVWNGNLNGGALARGASYRFYTVYSAEILTGKGADDLEYMTYPAAYADELYLPTDHTY
ncbi:MAG: hypothetical protein LBP73_06175, partial [Clostridiales Family XIII bacterium]|nr:hypothetical protein [Clostridiales Family XIII bacterium]